MNPNEQAGQVLTSIGQAAPSAEESAKAFLAITAAVLQPHEVGNATFFTLPKNFELRDVSEAVEKTRDTPSRKRGTVQLGDLASLLTYAADQDRMDSGYLYADPDSRTITAVFNDTRTPTEAGWRDFRAAFKAEYTPEFDLWKRYDKQHMSQTDFAEFIEANFADLAEADAQTLLTVATTIQATNGINFSSARRLQDGQTQITYNETLDTKAGADGALKIPQTFMLGLRIFKNGDGYKLRARLKYRLHSGSVKFWYELDRPERAVEDAFGGYVAELREKSGYTVLIGKP